MAQLEPGGQRLAMAKARRNGTYGEIKAFPIDAKLVQVVRWAFGIGIHD